MSEEVIDLEDCLLDGPLYRQKISDCEMYLLSVEHSLKNVVKAARGVIDLTHRTF